MKYINAIKNKITQEVIINESQKVHHRKLSKQFVAEKNEYKEKLEKTLNEISADPNALHVIDIRWDEHPSTSRIYSCIVLYAAKSEDCFPPMSPDDVRPYGYRHVFHRDDDDD